MHKPKNQAGQITGRDILITATITIGLAILITVAFLIWNGRTQRISPKGSESFPVSSQKQESNKADGTGAGGEQTGQEAQKPGEENFQGVLTAISEDNIVILDKKTNKDITISLSKNTIFEYNGKPFDKSQFYIGDQLMVTGIKQEKSVSANKITVLVAASPNMPAPMPVKVDVRPDGSLKPLGGS